MSSLNLFSIAIAGIEYVRAVDTYIELTQPFKRAKEDPALVGTILYNCAEALRIASVLLWPFIPDACKEFWRRIGCSQYADALHAGRGDLDKWTQWGQLQPGTTIEKGPALFPRYEVKQSG